MASFLITFKPASENAQRGWPLESLTGLVRRLESGEAVEENWRFHNRKEVSVGDRVFLLLQGKLGPAIIGYGRASGEPNGDKQVPISFEGRVDPSRYALAQTF